MKNNENLLNRTLEFSEKIIVLYSKLPKNTPNIILLKQSIRSISSIGANYREACEAETPKDFEHKIGIVKKEARESNYWLTLLLRSNTSYSKDISILIKESDELIRIFSSILNKFKSYKK